VVHIIGIAGLATGLAACSSPNSDDDDTTGVSVDDDDSGENNMRLADFEQVELECVDRLLALLDLRATSPVADVEASIPAECSEADCCRPRQSRRCTPPLPGQPRSRLHLRRPTKSTRRWRRLG